MTLHLCFSISSIMSNVIFYSKHCKHCSELISLINSQNLGSLIQLACVDTMQRHTIPKMVTSVPTVYTSQRTFITDSDCFDYIAQLAKSQQPQELQAYNDGFGLGSNFESLENPNAQTGGFFFLDGTQETPMVSDGRGKKSNNDIQLENLMQARKLDDERMFGSNPQLRRG